MKGRILLMILLFIVFVSQAQNTFEDDSQNKITSKNISEVITPGDELIKFTQVYFAGFAITFVGGGLILLDQVVLPNQNEDYKSNNLLIYFGLGLAITGLGLELFSFTHIGNAGDLLNKERLNQTTTNISLKIEATQYGVGIVCRF